MHYLFSYKLFATIFLSLSYWIAIKMRCPVTACRNAAVSDASVEPQGDVTDMMTDILKGVET